MTKTGKTKTRPAEGAHKLSLRYVLGSVGFLFLGLTLIGTSFIGASHSAPTPSASFGVTSTEGPASTITATLPALEGAHVSIPSLGVEVPWVPSGTSNGVMDVPAAPMAGWYEQSAKPGAAQGTTIVAAHVDFPDRTLTPFGKLAEIQKDTPIFVAEDDGTIHQYRVTALNTYSQEALPAELFTRVGDPTLVLVTCSGKSIQGPADDSGQWGYEDNLTVTAALVIP